MANLFLTLIFLGCARYPPQMETLGDRIIFRFTLKGEIDPTYYYFVFLNIHGNSAEGPFPIIYGPPWPMNENTCATGYTHFIRYTMGQFLSFVYDATTKMDNPSTPPPISQISPDGRTIEFTITRKWLGDAERISFNIITIDYKPTDPGWQGTRNIDYLDSGPVEIPLNQNGIYRGTDASGDCLPPLDIISWVVEVKLAG
ncbi:MAG: hypothetical protein ACPLPS_08350 [bacterium]